MLRQHLRRVTDSVVECRNTAPRATGRRGEQQRLAGGAPCRCRSSMTMMRGLSMADGHRSSGPAWRFSGWSARPPVFLPPSTATKPIARPNGCPARWASSAPADAAQLCASCSAANAASELAACKTKRAMRMLGRPGPNATARLRAASITGCGMTMRGRWRPINIACQTGARVSDDLAFHLVQRRVAAPACLRPLLEARRQAGAAAKLTPWPGRR